MSAIAVLFGCRNEGGKDKGGLSDTLAMLASSLGKTHYPIQFGDDGRIDSIFLSETDSTLTLAMVVAEDFVDSALLTSNESRRAFTLRLALSNDKVKEIIKMARMVPLDLEVSVATPKRPAVDRFVIERRKFHLMSLDAPSERERDEVLVHNRVIYDNGFCPYSLEDGVTMLSMTVQDRYVTFRTEIDVEKLDFSLMKQNRDSVNVAVVESLRSQLADSLSRNSLLDIARARLGYRNRYVSSDWLDSFDISFTPADLERLIAAGGNNGKNSNNDKN